MEFILEDDLYVRRAKVIRNLAGHARIGRSGRAWEVKWHTRSMVFWHESGSLRICL